MLRASLLLLVSIATMSAAVTIQKTAYKGWPNAYRITNGTIELVVTADVGPRVIRAGFVGGQNLFKEFDDQLGKSGEKDWKLRGGHRIWVAPEVAPDLSPITYAADNHPVAVEIKGNTLIATPPLEKEAGIQKQLILSMTNDGKTEVTHRITNKNIWPVELAPWVLTMMAQGGVQVTGLPPRGTHPEVLAPTNTLTIWAFTHLNDPRWKFTEKYILLRQDPKNSVPQKIGHLNRDTWGAYVLNGEAFIKRSTGDPSKRYPDLGSSYETFTNADFLELETLGPLVTLEPGQTAEHIERWTLHRGVDVKEMTDSEIDRVLLPLVKW